MPPKNVRGNEKADGNSVTASTLKPNAKPGVVASAGQTSRMADAALANLKLEQCKYCQRKFTGDRLSIHEQVCLERRKGKVGKNTSRKQYDSAKHRLSGTAAEGYLRKPKTSEGPKQTPNNWRQQHADLINSIRAAKAAELHLAAGGNPADLPPPPPSDYSNYKECPYCGRRFNQEAAERHIPACKDMIHNKTGVPKSGQSKNMKR